MKPWPRNATRAALLAALSAACGGVENPDLGAGVVAGRVAGATASGYAYVYGRPELRAPLGPDGGYRLRGVPVGAQQVVLFDGADRAELAAVNVSPAATSDLSRDARRMPLAGRIVAAARPPAGFSPGAALLEVEGTPLRAAAAQGPAELFPLPGGTYQVRAEMEGFSSARATVAVGEGARATAELQLAVDDEDREHRGCLSAPCATGLTCDHDDGRCYACEKSSDCAAGEVCQEHACVAQAPGLGQPCADDRDCAAIAGGTCYRGHDGGYCTVACRADADCPAGFRECPKSDGAATGLCAR